MNSDICIIRGEESLNYPGKPLSIETRRKRLYPQNTSLAFFLYLLDVPRGRGITPLD